mgnify:CR=1 FL=1
MKANTTLLNFEYGISSQMSTSQFITAQDQACFEEIHKVLKKHEALDRFGLTLLDQQLDKNQIRLETNSRLDRTLLTKVTTEDQGGNYTIQTNWRLNTMKAVAECQTKCEAQTIGKHTDMHN